MLNLIRHQLNLLKLMKILPNDPIKVLLNVFSKLHIKDEAASIQFIFKPSVVSI